jgi:hypothetical protein
MVGLYLYCLRESAPGYLAAPTKGIDGNGEVLVLPFRDLEAIVSEVALEAFASEEIQRKAQEDLNWIKEKAVIHARVVQEAMGRGHILLDLIPMRFGTIFKDRARLEEVLEKDYLRIREVLERIRGKQEWSVKVYLKDRRKFEQVIKEKNETIKEKEREIASLPEGMAFFVEEELKETISKEMEKELNNTTKSFFERLKKQALASEISKILGKELTGRQEPMVLNAAYLIPEENIEDFQKEAIDINQQIEKKGFFLEYSGPWPAYNFTSLDNFSSLTG